MWARTFEQYTAGRDNNFDFLRFLFASLVMFSHSFAFLYNGTLMAYDPLLQLTRGQTAFGGGSVDGFFLISGFLVTQSWERTRDWKSFAAKRCLRIFPGLVVVLIAIVFVVGPLAVTDRSAYFHNPHTYNYLGLMLTKDIDASDHIPGVFENNPEHGRIDGSLWTIRYELLCYVMVAVVGLLGLYKRPVYVLPLLGVFWALKASHLLHIHSFGKFDNLFHLATFFAVGMVFYLFRKRILYSGWIALACVVAMILLDWVHRLAVFEPILFGYVLFWVAYSPQIKLHHFARHGDISYGLYLYACPVQQLLTTYFRFSLNAYTLFLAAFPLTALCAIASWKLVEAPFLRLKPKSAPAHAPRVANDSPLDASGSKDFATSSKELVGVVNSSPSTQGAYGQNAD